MSSETNAPRSISEPQIDWHTISQNAETNYTLLYKRNQELTARLEAVQKHNAMLVGALKGIQYLIGFEWLRPEFNEARDAISATSAECEAFMQAEIVKRLGEPVAWRATNWSGSCDDYIYRDADDRPVNLKLEAVGEPLYRLPEPLATPEEQRRGI